MRLAIGLGFFLIFAMAAPLGDAQPVNGTSSCPRIVSRAEWKARKPRLSPQLMPSPVPYVVVHHGGISKYCKEQHECAAIVRSYQDLHLDDRGWNDIGYSFVIGEDGNVYEGRGWNAVGAHSPGYNTQSIGVSIIGDYTNFLPNDAALKALDSIISCGLSLGKIHEDYHVIGHRQARNTACPGEKLFEHVKAMPAWTDKPNAVYANSSINQVPANN